MLPAVKPDTISEVTVIDFPLKPARKVVNPELTETSNKYPSLAPMVVFQFAVNVVCAMLVATVATGAAGRSLRCTSRQKILLRIGLRPNVRWRRPSAGQ